MTRKRKSLPDEAGAMRRRLQRLRRQLAGAVRPIVWLRAAPGSGKTRLLAGLGTAPRRAPFADWQLLDSPSEELARAALAAVELDAGATHRRLLIATRDDDVVSRLLLRSQTYGRVDLLDAQDLYLAQAECRSPAELAAWDATGGWPVLVDAFLNGRAVEMQRLLPEFLLEEVLPHLPQPVVVALYAALSTPLTDESLASLSLSERLHPLLRRSGAHTTIAGSWVRDALLVLRRRPRALPKVVVERLTQILSSTNDPARAIESLLQLGQTEHALELFKRSGGQFFGHEHGYRALERVLRAMGPELEPRCEDLFFARLWLMIKIGQPREALLRLESRHPGLPVDLRRLRLSHRPYALLLRIDIGLELDEAPPAEVISSWGRLQALLPAGDDLAQGLLFNCMAIGFLQVDALLEAEQLSKESLAAYARAHSPYLVHCMLLHLCDVAIRQSRTGEAAETLRRAERELQHSGQAFNSEPAIVACFRSRIAYEEGRFADCPAESAPILEALSEGDSWPDLIVSMAAHFVMTGYWSGGLRNALDRLDQFVLTLSRRHGSTQHLRLKLLRIRLLQVARRHPEAGVQIEEYELEPDGRRSAFLATEEQLIVLRHLLSQDAIPRQVARIAAALAQQPHLELRQKITLSILQAYWRQRSGEAALSRRHLRIALRDAESRNLVGVLAEDSEYLERLLPAFLAAPGPGGAVLGHHAQRVLRILQAMPSAPQWSKAAAGISRQEHRVLAYLVDGYSNKQIAGALALSNSTVKFHLRNLFKKLDVSSRAGLVAAIQERGITT